jgi:putative membrane protein
VLRVRGRIGVSLLSLFITAVQSSVLGALLSFARIPWYAHYERLAGVGRALDDQRLAGLIMWVPGSVPYLIAALWIVRRSLLPNRRSGESSESHRFWRLTTAPRAP